MKRKVSLIVLIIGLLMLVVAVPVMAEPTKGQKVPILLIITSPKTLDPGTFIKNKGDVDQLRDKIILWQVVKLTIQYEVPVTLTGSAISERDGMTIISKTGMAIYHDTIVISFPEQGGGFEGFGELMMTNYPTATNVAAHFVFHGTGAFEGQTLNAWRDAPLSVSGSEGYLLKP